MRNGADSRRGRRRLLYGLGTGLAGFTLTGCLDSGRVGYESGPVPDVNGSNRSTREQIAAVASATTSTVQGVSPLETLSLDDHGFVFEDGYQGSTVQGSVLNRADERVELAEVRVRVYDESGAQLGRYFARTGDLDGGSTWSFTVIVLQPPARLDRYEIAVLGTPG
ncbi:FxLYD domain-containing protein [Halovivax limisalsi]|uniref:FxLYD domain-containing protein n=1 Tax=Halovivax limisalsi TaxID=1453760 RepID=UPI001FFD5B6E|nr:FxLYD domain-containing protein [Halovivax limisalsi]